MSKKTYLNLLILCGILTQGIVGTFSEDNHENSSNLHLRRKRLVYHSSEQRELSIRDVPYIVKIIQNGTRVCAGIIISPVHILTIKICVDEQRTAYAVESGELLISTVRIHRVRDIFFVERLAMVCIDPPIAIDSPSLHRKILLLERPIQPHALVTINGLAPIGSRSIDGMEAPYFRKLTNILIVNQLMCFNFYQHYNYEITSNDICTLESSGERGCTHEDGGSALVVDNKLVGVLNIAGSIRSRWSPDVFIRVIGNNVYYKWIKSYANLYDSHPPNALKGLYRYNQNLHPQHPHTLYNPHTN